MYILRNLQEQLTGFRFLIGFLKLFRETNSLISVGIRSQILDPKNETGYCFCAVVNWIYYRTFEGIFMSQIMSVFFTNSENFIHNFRTTNIHDFLHLNVYILQTSNMYWDRIILFKEFLTSQFFVAVY